MDENKCCCGVKTKKRTEKEYRDLTNRLSRIEGRSEASREWWSMTPTALTY